MFKLFFIKYYSWIILILILLMTVPYSYCDGTNSLGFLTLTLPQPVNRDIPIADGLMELELPDDEEPQEDQPVVVVKPTWFKVILKTSLVIVLGITTIVVAGYVVPKLADTTIKQAKETSKMWGELLRTES
jgi:hypothetical protein